MKTLTSLHRSLCCALFCLLLITMGSYIATAQCPAATPLILNSVNTTESRCQASGTATVSASGGATPYTYSIIAGPTLSPPQSSNVLQSLAPGTYTVQVTDNCNTSVTRNITVPGTYTVPSVSLATQSPSCSGNSDGSITINATDGRAPLTYSLVSPSPVIAGPQTSNVFSGLPIGNYTCQVTDSCGNFQTRTTTLSAAAGTTAYLGGDLQYIACDSFVVTLFVDASVYKPPYTISVTLPDGRVLTDVLTSPPVDILGRIWDAFHFRYHHVTGATETLAINITNGCGTTGSGTYWMLGMDMNPQANLTSGCSNQYFYTLDPFEDNNQFPSALHCGTITYTLLSPSGAVLATQTNNSTFAGYPPGTGYKVVRQDCCEKDTLQFDWAAAAPPFKITAILPGSDETCKEGTTSLVLLCNPVGKVGSIIVASGPPAMTFADGTVLPLNYPDTLKNLTLGIQILSYFTAGTYKFYVIDTCGNKDSATYTVAPPDLLHSTFAATLVKGCAGANKILLNATSNSAFGSLIGNIAASTGYSKPVQVSPFKDSLVNLSPGTYYANYQYKAIYNPTYLHGMDNLGCDVISDTLVIPAYTQPVFNPSAAIAVCGATRQMALLPDTSSGVSPYTYQAIAGPAITAAQPSPVFPGLASGTYTFQMVDACANSYSRSMTVDTLAVPNVATSGSTCGGGSATFSLPSSPFFSYGWQLPNGSTTTGNSITLSPVKVSDTGTYTISVTSSIGGCTNTSSKSFNLSLCSAMLPELLVRFSGQWNNGNLQLFWQTTDEINMSYYIVERSTDGFRFTPVQQVVAMNGTLNKYAQMDMHVPAGAIYYRLRMVENGGNIHYSPIISFNKAHTQQVNVYPRLVTGNVPVMVTYPVTNGSAFIRVVGIDGRIYRTIAVPVGSTQTSIDTGHLSNGSYLVEFAGNGGVAPTQIWKE